jgi:hypothetical protein
VNVTLHLDTSLLVLEVKGYKLTHGKILYYFDIKKTEAPPAPHPSPLQEQKHFNEINPRQPTTKLYA